MCAGERGGQGAFSIKNNDSQRFPSKNNDSQFRSIKNNDSLHSFTQNNDSQRFRKSGPNTSSSMFRSKITTHNFVPSKIMTHNFVPSKIMTHNVGPWSVAHSQFWTLSTIGLQCFLILFRSTRAPGGIWIRMLPCFEQSKRFPDCRRSQRFFINCSFLSFLLDLPFWKTPSVPTPFTDSLQKGSGEARGGQNTCATSFPWFVGGHLEVKCLSPTRLDPRHAATYLMAPTYLTVDATI